MASLKAQLAQGRALGRRHLGHARGSSPLAGGREGAGAGGPPADRRRGPSASRRACATSTRPPPPTSRRCRAAWATTNRRRSGSATPMVRLRELERQIDARRSVYETALTRATPAPGAAAGRRFGDARPSRPPRPPAHRKGPIRRRAARGRGAPSAWRWAWTAALLAEAVAGRVPHGPPACGQRLGLDVGRGPIPPAGNGAAAEARQDLALARLNTSLEALPVPGHVRMTIVTAADAVSGQNRCCPLQLAMMAAAEHGRALLVDADPGRQHDGRPAPAGHGRRRRGLGDMPSVRPERRPIDFPGLSFLSAGAGTDRVSIPAGRPTASSNRAGGRGRRGGERRDARRRSVSRTASSTTRACRWWCWP